jgi:hypothetical protein
LYVAHVEQEIEQKYLQHNGPLNQDGSRRKTMKSFMKHSTCSAADFLHPRYAELARMLKYEPVLHRKFWEWIYIVHHLIRLNAVGPGRCGLVFGVGSERLPALFASMGSSIVATDAPVEIMTGSGFLQSGEHASGLDNLRQPSIVDNNVFDKLVSYRACDMNKIDPALTEFDFNWSSCCFEHLGSLQAGHEFVINAVENTLKVGGIAVHTTEFNLSSNEDTWASGPTVIYRLQDIERLANELRSRGHEVDPILIAPHVHKLDFHVDVPPYNQDPHLKLALGEYVCTSVGLVIRRGY